MNHPNWKGKGIFISILLLLVIALPTTASSKNLPDTLLNEAVAGDDSDQTGRNAPPTPEYSWPQVQGDANRSGYVPHTVGPPFTELWRIGKYAPDPNGNMFPVSSRVQPIIAQGFVFMPSNDNSLYAINTTNGNVSWSYATEGPLVNSAAYADGQVFVGSTDHHIYALDAGNGTFLWRYKTGSTVKTAPLVANGKIFMGSSDGYMYALNQTNGTLAWRTKIGAPIFDTAAYDNGKVFFGGMDSTGYALDANTGTILWSVPIKGQGFRDRWTVAGNGRVLFTPMLAIDHHQPLRAGTTLFSTTASTIVYDQPWSIQRQQVLAHLAANPYHQPLSVLDQNTGTVAFIPPVLLASGGSQSPHAQPVLLPNGNTNVIYRRSFGEPAQYGQTTNDALYTGELDLSTGDITPVDRCTPGSGGWIDCGGYKSPFVSDESAALVRSGDIIYLDTARGTVGLNTQTQTTIPLAAYNNSTGSVFANSPIILYPGHTEWIYYHDYENVLSEVTSDGNDLKRPTPIVGDTLYIFHYNTLVAVRGTIQ